MKQKHTEVVRFFGFSSSSSSSYGTVIFSLLVFSASILSAATAYTLQDHQAMAQQQITTIGGSNFLTYDNATLGYRIQYPSNWEQFEQLNSVRFISPFQGASDRYREIVSVNLESFSNVSMAEWIRNATNALNSTANDFVLSASSPATHAGLPAHMLEYSYSDPSFGVTKTIVISTISDNRNVYSITYFAKPEEFDNSLPIVQEMIDSFQLYTASF